MPVRNPNNTERELLDVATRLLVFVRASIEVAHQRLEAVRQQTTDQFTHSRDRLARKKEAFQQWVLEAEQWLDWAADKAELVGELVERARRDMLCEPKEQVKELTSILQEDLNYLKVEVFMRKLDAGALQAAEERVIRTLVEGQDQVVDDVDEVDATQRLHERVSRARNFEADVEAEASHESELTEDEDQAGVSTVNQH